jgi:predicted acyl esterase
MHFVFVAIASVLAGGVTAQCVRPTPPPSGLTVNHTLTVPVTYSDSYVGNGSLLLPSGPAPVCGWPLVVYVHWLGGSRFEESDLQLFIAQQGYAVWSYDVRGQGETVALNPGHINMGSTLWGPVERHDLAEQVEWVASAPAWQGLIDATRLGIIGTSQGGAHGWAAAALSGELLTTPGRTPITFPVVSCALPRDLVANSTSDWLRQGELFSTWWLDAVSGNYTALPLDPLFVLQARTAFVNQSPASLRAAWLLDGRDLAARLAVSKVPVFYSHAYFDLVSGPLSGLEHLESMQGPVRSMLSTLGHNVPNNHLERTANKNLTLRWLHRYLWDEQNEVELETPHQLAMVPLSAMDRDDVNFAWNRANVDSLMPSGSAERFFLTDGFVLDPLPPSSTQGDVRIAQVIDPNATTFNPADYFDQPAVRAMPHVLTVCPNDERVWQMVVPSEGEVNRSALLHLELVPDAASWMVAVNLSIEPIGGEEVTVASDVIVSRNSVPGVIEQHDLRLPPVSVHIPSGATVRLRLSSLWLHQFPMQPRLAVAPLFTDFAVDIKQGGQPTSSWLELPVRPMTPKLVVEQRAIDLATMPQIDATLRGGLGRAGAPYFVAVGFGGIVPSTSYLGVTVPVEGDWLVVASAASTLPYYVGFLGFLDASGEADCSVDYSVVAPLTQVLNGRHLTMAAFVWDFPWAQSGEATNACEVALR